MILWHDNCLILNFEPLSITYNPYPKPNSQYPIPNNQLKIVGSRCVTGSCPKGFTLIELMIVIAIIGILVAIAVPQFNAYRLRGYNIGAMADVKNASIAEDAFFVDNQAYSSSLAVLTAYGFRQTQSVSVGVSGDANAYTITAYHSSGNTTYTIIGPEGTLTSN